MDDADIAGDETDKYEADAIAAISKASTRRDLIPVGHCYDCHEPVPQHHLFCNGLCSMYWHKRQARIEANK
jgi:hypothetical protein